MDDTLKPNVISRIFRDEKISMPIVQITDLKLVAQTDGDAPKRIKATIADGEFFGSAVLASDSTRLILSEKVKVNSLVRLKNYVMNNLKNTKICIVLGMEQVGEDEMEKVGEPVSWDTGCAAPAAAAAATTAASASPMGAVKKEGTTTPHTAPAGSRMGAAAPARPPPPMPTGELDALRATPIEALNPYSSKWMIKARVMNKGDLKRWTNAKGEGCLFSMDVADESSEIRVTCFREVAERFYNMVEVGKTYLISKGQLKIADKKFSTLNNNYEITLGFETQIQLCADEPDVKPKVHYRFCAIGDIANRPTNATVDVIGVAHNVGPTQNIVSKTSGKEMTKRTLSIADDSGMAIELTLWGEKATSFGEENAGKVCAFKGFRVSEWNTKSLGANFGASFEVAPEHEATERIESWWANGGSGTQVSLSVDSRGGAAGGVQRDESLRTSTAELSAKEATMASGDAEYATIRGYVSKHLGTDDKPLWFRACPKCSKKVVGDDLGCNCENCGWSGRDPTYRYIAPLILTDEAGTCIATAFNDTATAFIGKPAEEMKALKQTNPAAFDAVWSEALWKPYLFRVRAKVETYNAVSRLKMAIVSAAKVNFVTEGNNLLKDIAKYDLPAAEPAAESTEVKAEA